MTLHEQGLGEHKDDSSFLRKEVVRDKSQARKAGPPPKPHIPGAASLDSNRAGSVSLRYRALNIQSLQMLEAPQFS